MVEDNEIYNDIVIEFKLSSSILEKMKSEVEVFTTVRRDICKLLKITMFEAETLKVYEKEFIKNIDINKLKIKDFEKKQIELKDKIKQCKHEIKLIKLNLNKLENRIVQEQKQSKKYNAALRIFLKREKFKFIKKILFTSYRRVFLKYSNEFSIKTKIMECNKRKEKIRQEKQYVNNSINKYNKKIILDKVALAQMRKNIINMEKGIVFFQKRLKSLGDYKEMEKKFKLECQYYRN